VDVETAVDKSLHIGLCLSVPVGSPKQVTISSEAKNFPAAFKSGCCDMALRPTLALNIAQPGLAISLSHHALHETEGRSSYYRSLNRNQSLSQGYKLNPCALGSRQGCDGSERAPGGNPLGKDRPGQVQQRHLQRNLGFRMPLEVLMFAASLLDSDSSEGGCATKALLLAGLSR
jgi:hypothetical protein